MKFKKNLDEVVKRNKKLWSGDFTRGVLAKIDIDGFSTLDLWEKVLLPQYCPDYKKMFDVFLEFFKKREFLLDDAIPCARPNIGDSAFGAYLGAELIFGNAGGFAKPLLKNLDSINDLKYDPENYWISNLIEATKYFAQKSEGLFATSIIETMDSLNLAENLYGSNAYLEIYNNPVKLLELFDFGYYFNVRMIEEQRKYIKMIGDGYIDLHEEWLPGKCIWLSVDAWGNCSSEIFKKIGVYHLQKIINYFSCGWLHMHNSHLHLLEEVIKIKNLAGIGILDDPGQIKCFKRLKDIQKITKYIPLQICCSKEDFTNALKDKSLPCNVMYWINSGVASIEEANKIMEMVYNY